MYTPKQYWFQWISKSGRMLYFESAAEVYRYSLKEPPHRIVYYRWTDKEVIKRFYYGAAAFAAELAQPDHNSMTIS